jgi:hypothetical protein
MKVRVIRSFGFYKRGQEFEWPDGVARMFVARGMVAEVPADIEAAAVEPEVERADARPRARKRK